MICLSLDSTWLLIWKKKAEVISMIVQILHVNILGFLYSISSTDTYVEKILPVFL